jgi:hypothetical protein
MKKIFLLISLTYIINIHSQQNNNYDTPYTIGGQLDGKKIAEDEMELMLKAQKEQEDRLLTNKVVSQTQQTDPNKALADRVAKINKEAKDIMSSNYDSNFAFGRSMDYEPEKNSWTTRNYNSNSDSKTNKNDNYASSYNNEKINTYASSVANNNTDYNQNNNIRKSVSNEGYTSNSDNIDDEDKPKKNIIILLFNIVLLVLAWFIFGTIISYLIYKNEPNSELGKNETAKTLHILLNITAIIIFFKILFFKD